MIIPPWAEYRDEIMDELYNYLCILHMISSITNMLLSPGTAVNDVNPKATPASHTV